MKKLILALAGVLVLSGCANTNEYGMYSDSQSKIEVAKFAAEAAKYKAISDIAATGSESAKIAAVVALAVSAGNSGNQTAQLKPPEHNGQAALQWASILFPAATQMYGLYSNVKLGIAQSNNYARTAESTNATYLGMAGKIQAPVFAVPQANVTTTNTDRHDTSSVVTSTLSGTGVLGSGSYATTNNPTNYSLTGTGTLGGGAYSTTSTSSVLSGTGNLGSGSYNTSSPVVTVTPVITTQPVVVTPVVTNPPVVVTNP